MTTPVWLEPLSPGLFAIDTGYTRDRFDAAYLVVDSGRAAFIDSGTQRAVPRLLGALAQLGLSPQAVDWVLPTHVHLDHAGGCGGLMQALPRARLRVHPSDARHLIDPSVLEASTRAVYGDDAFERAYGRLVPIPADRVDPVDEGDAVQVGSRRLLAAHTPGHARHHICYWDARSAGWFAGDTFGVSYRELDVDGRPWLHPATTPTQFDPEALKTSIARLVACQPEAMYLTHYAAVRDPAHGARHLTGLIDRMVALSLPVPRDERRHATLRQHFADLYVDSLRAHGSSRPRDEIVELLDMDLELNAQGVALWLDRRAAARAGAPAEGVRQ